jgi:hypothetical protein
MADIASDSTATTAGARRVVRPRMNLLGFGVLIPASNAVVFPGSIGETVARTVRATVGCIE